MLLSVGNRYGLPNDSLMSTSPRFLRLPALLEKLGGVSADLVYSWMKTRGFPKPMKLSRKVSLWDLETVEGWMELRAREAQQTPKAA